MLSNALEEMVSGFFIDCGFSVSKIAETDTEVPDLLVKAQDHWYLVEIKDKKTDQTLMELLESSIPGERTLPLGKRNRLSGIIRKGVGQLESYQGNGHQFNLLWFTLNEMTLEKLVLRDGETSLSWVEDLTQRQLFSTLYGYVDVNCYASDGSFFETGCFYFCNSEFYRFQQLHAVFIQTSKELILCVNDLSDRYADFCRSSLYQSLVQQGILIVEPYKRETENHCLLVDGDVDRNDIRTVSQYLMARYHLLHVRPYQYVLVNLPV